MTQTIQQALTEAPITAIFVVFWAGAFASLSSCTLVRIPIVLGYMSGTTDSKSKSILLTLLFVSGLVFSYTIFGILLGIMGNLTYSLIRINKYKFWTLGPQYRHVWKSNWTKRVGSFFVFSHFCTRRRRGRQ